ncbi:hypothetical protein FTX61_14040 [Nitriliruptoraceae bacterium ZYF776]|nr:hypothetical protein [Profundirhabdus halotolerans]
MRTAVLAAALVAGLAIGAPVDAATPDGLDDGSDAAALEALDRAVVAAQRVPHRGEVTVVSFSAEGPQVTTVALRRTAEGDLEVRRLRGVEVGDAADAALRPTRTGALLRLGGVERANFDRDRFLAAYRVVHGGAADVDTGPATRLEVSRRATGALREVLFVDDATGLLVRRETFDPDGLPVRLVAFTELSHDPDVVAPPPEIPRASPAAAALELDGRFPGLLPGGFELLDLRELEDTEVPVTRLVYDDGLYTLSLFVQDGRLDPKATDGASAMRTPTGGTVWRWPGSEPRRVVWSGDGRTFTALSDAPTADVVAAVADLPNAPPPSTLERLTRGLSRVWKQLLPPWGD